MSLESVRRQLRQAESLAAEANRLAGIGIWHYHVQSDTLFWSDEQYRIFGVQPGDYVPTQQGYLDFVHPDDLAEVQRQRARIGPDGMTPIEHRIVRGDGEIRYLLHRTRIAEMDGFDGPSRIGVVQDITERRRAELQLEAQAHELREMQAELIYLSRLSAMGTMASTLGHELNQPLTAIVNYAAVARQVYELGPEAGDRLREALDGVAQNAMRAGTIIRSLRGMIRPGEARRDPFPLGEAIEQAIRLATLGAPEGIEFRRDLPSQTRVIGDTVQIQQVLVNLIRNACDAVRSAPVKTVSISAVADARTVTVHVDDSGPGIAAEALPGLFEARLAQKEGGIEFGLSISRTIVEAHGGRIAGGNRPEGGARFSFTLPLAEEDEPRLL